MKRKFAIFGLLALLIVATGVWLVGRQKQRSPVGSTTISATPTPTSTPEGGFPTPIVSTATRQIPGGPFAPADPRWADRRQRQQQDPQYEWKTPIKFYGIVLDQNQQPISGVEASMEWTDMSPKGSSEATRTTDANGKFSITGIQGKNLNVRSLKKEGYAEARKTNPHGFEYVGFWEPSYYEPDSNNPVVFHMWKKGASEPMIQRGPTLLGAQNDGTPTSFDLATGRKTTTGSGNIALRITKGQKANKRFDWTATVEGLGGTGLIESTDEFMATAPADGYQPQWTFSQKTDDEKYQSEVQTKFYVKTGDGKYARVEIRIIPEYNETAAVDLTVYMNPSGSRNLEFNPDKAIKSP